MSFLIPKSSSCKFKEFFTEFDRDLDKLALLSYGVSITTLEEVFLKVGHLEDPALAFTTPSTYKTPVNNKGDLSLPPINTGRNREAIRSPDSLDQLKEGGEIEMAEILSDDVKLQSGKKMIDGDDLTDMERLSNEETYSIKNAKMDRSFCYNLKAVLFKRWSKDKRNRKAIVTEMVAPSLLMIVGILIA